MTAARSERQLLIEYLGLTIIIPQVRILAMRDLSLEAICQGILVVHANASELLEDAKLLRREGRVARAYALAYFACEEAGKVSILVGAATRVALGVQIDWKSTSKRFRSHDSKASQFLGLARSIPLLLEAVAAGSKKVDRDEVMLKASVGAFFGPTLFGSRNASLYCDFENGTFISPAERINDSMADAMLKNAETLITTFEKVLGKTAAETAQIIRSSSNRARYDAGQADAAAAADEIIAGFAALRSGGKSTAK
jgi:AbiV family abortive infection protein